MLEAAFVLGVVADFVTVTFFWPLFLQVTSDFPQVLNFVLQFQSRGRCATCGPSRPAGTCTGPGHTGLYRSLGCSTDVSL